MKPDVVAALDMGQGCERLQPDNVSIQTLNRYLEALLAFATLGYNGGVENLEELRAIDAKYGSTEAEVVASYGMMSTTDHDLVQQGLDLLDDAKLVVLPPQSSPTSCPGFPSSAEVTLKTCSFSKSSTSAGSASRGSSVKPPERGRRRLPLRVPLR